MNHDLLKKIVTCPRLPSLPTIAIEVIALTRQPDINIKQIAKTISNDAALSTKILRTVNSSFYGLSKSVSTISHALVILGLNSVKTLALGFSLVSNYRDIFGDDYDPARFWRRSLCSAVGSRALAARLGILETEETFLGGLLQDIGQMAMIQTVGRRYVQLLTQAHDDHRRLVEMERAVFDLDHTQVGAALADLWMLPPILSVPIRWHEQPEGAPPELLGVVRTVALGARSADIFLQPEPTVHVDAFFRSLQEWFGASPEVGQELLKAIATQNREMAALFDLKAEPVRDIEEILAQANETLTQLSLQTQANAHQLEERNRQLQEQVVKDPLTGVSNRGRFNDFMKQQFADAANRQRSLGLLLLDVDFFKRVNDTHGHIAGDQVLVFLAKLMAQFCPERGEVARYGGEEFVMVLPGMGRREAAQLADQVRQAVAAASVRINNGNALKITVSLGVACYDGRTVFERSEQLIRASDQALYAAKGAGRNCVRVFTPRALTQPAA